jgi:hypothetical protein
MTELPTLTEAKPLTADDLQFVRTKLPSYDQLPDLMTPKEVEQYTRIAVRTLAVDRSTARKILEWTKVGGAVLYLKTSIARHILQQRGRR